MRWLRPAVVVVAGLALVAAGIWFFIPEIPMRIALGLERSRAGLVKHEVDLPGGLTMAYLEGGRGAPLVLLHGFGADKDTFVRVAPYLTSHYRLIIPDLIGFGESSHPADADYSPRAQAERVRAFCRALGLPFAHVGGSSMGGEVALSWAAAYPLEVSSLWLLDTAGIGSAPESDVARTIRETGQNPLLVANVEDFDRLLALTMTRPPPVPRFVKGVLANRRIENRALEERIFRQIAGDSLEARIKGLKTPALVVFGAEDRVVDPGAAKVLRGLMPRSHVVIMPGVGHLPTLENPQLAASDYIRFRDSM